MKKLPSIYKNSIKKQINNNKNYCYLKDTSNDNINNTNKTNININNIVDKNINSTLDSIFNSLGYPYNINVLIKTKDKEYNTYLVTRNNNTITTLDNEIINMDDIISINRI